MALLQESVPAAETLGVSQSIEVPAILYSLDLHAST